MRYLRKIAFIAVLALGFLITPLANDFALSQGIKPKQDSQITEKATPAAADKILGLDATSTYFKTTWSHFLTAIQTQLKIPINAALFPGATADIQINSAISLATALGQNFVDATGIIGTQTLAANISITQGPLSIRFGNASFSGAYGITVSPGAHNVKIESIFPYGLGETAAPMGTVFVYTGTGTAVTVGSSASNTIGFTMDDIAIDMSGAGSSAIGIQLNRTQKYKLDSPRIGGLITSNSQKLIDLEGYTYYTGNGEINSPYLSNGNNMVYFGRNANANKISGGSFATIGTSTVFNFAGTSSGSTDGNVIVGGDAENANLVINFDYATNNKIAFLRQETNTTVMNATSNSSQNELHGVFGAAAQFVDAGTNNSYQDGYHYQFQRNRFRITDDTDNEFDFILGSGSGTDQNIYHYFRDKSNNNKWGLGKNYQNNFVLTDSANSINMLYLLSGGAAYLSSQSTAPVYINAVTNSSTGGLKIYSGGSSPAMVVAIGASGGAGTQTLTSGGATVSVPSGCRPICTDTATGGTVYPVACSVTGTTLTITGHSFDNINWFCY